MLYTAIHDQSGIHFYPLKENSIFVFCKCCQRFVPIPEPTGYIADGGIVGASIETFDMCDECFDAVCEAEDEYCKKLGTISE